MTTRQDVRRAAQNVHDMTQHALRTSAGVGDYKVVYEVEQRIVKLRQYAERIEELSAKVADLLERERAILEVQMA